MSAGEPAGISREEVLRQLGDPSAVAFELRQFTKSAQSSSADWPLLVERYANQWIAIYGGTVRAHEDTLDALLRVLDEQRRPLGQTLIRFVEDTPRTLIL
jgi:hypothetical protein